MDVYRFGRYVHGVDLYNTADSRKLVDIPYQ